MGCHRHRMSVVWPIMLIVVASPHRGTAEDETSRAVSVVSNNASNSASDGGDEVKSCDPAASAASPGLSLELRPKETVKFNCGTDPTATLQPQAPNCYGPDCTQGQEAQTLDQLCHGAALQVPARGSGTKVYTFTAPTDTATGCSLCYVCNLTKRGGKTQTCNVKITVVSTTATQAPPSQTEPPTPPEQGDETPPAGSQPEPSAAPGLLRDSSILAAVTLGLVIVAV